jgi:hypothetical protein
LCGNIVLLILGKHVVSSTEASTGLDEGSCEDPPEQEEEENDCDDEYDDGDDDDNDNDDDDDSDDESYKEKRNNGASTVALPVQQNMEDLLGYVSVQ